jgi:hypothetical protein
VALTSLQGAEFITLIEDTTLSRVRGYGNRWDKLTEIYLDRWYGKQQEEGTLA